MYSWDTQKYFQEVKTNGTNACMHRALGSFQLYPLETISQGIGMYSPTIFMNKKTLPETHTKQTKLLLFSFQIVMEATLDAFYVRKYEVKLTQCNQSKL